MTNNLSKYKLLSILYPIIHTIGYVLIVLLSTGDKNTTLSLGFFIFHALALALYFCLCEFLYKRYLAFLDKSPKLILVIALIILGISIFFCVASHFDFIDQNGNVESSKDRYIICSLLYLLSSSWFFIYIKVKRRDEISE